MMGSARGPKAIQKVKQSLFGFDTNPTIWALATLNMFSEVTARVISRMQAVSIQQIDERLRANSRVLFLIHHFRKGEPERDFIDAAMDALEPEGILAVVVKAGIFADDDNKPSRPAFTKKHSILAMISLPEDLFYPTSAPTSILVAKAHLPQNSSDRIMMARVWNDGYDKLKGRRVEVPGSQLPEILDCFHKLRKRKRFEIQHSNNRKRFTN